MRRPSTLVAWVTGGGGVLLIAYNILDAYTTLLSFAAPHFLDVLGTPIAWVLLFLCFCTLWWQVHNPEATGSDELVYREVIRLREENENLQRVVAQISPRRLTDQQRSIIRARLEPVVKAWGWGPQIAVFWTGAGDTADYAKQFDELLQSIGFHLLRVGGPSFYSGLQHDY